MRVRVSAVQLEFAYASSPQAFADVVRAPIELAAAQGAQLALLPHTAPFMLFGMFDMDAAPNETLDTLAQRQGVATPYWVRERAAYVFEFYLHLFQSLAERAELWLVPGSVIEPEGDALYLTALLLNPAGEIVGRQRKRTLTPQEQAWGISPGDTLRVFETELGDYGILIGEDIHDTRLAESLAANGARGLLYPAALRAGEPIDDLERAVQAHRVFGVRANLVGGEYRGRSVIYAPHTDPRAAPLTLARGASDARAELLLADLESEPPQ